VTIAVEGWSIIAAAGVMGLAGLPHCVAMCAAPCAAAAGRGPAAQPLFQVARVAGYAAAGAVAAAGVGALREALSYAPLLRPLWTLLHVAALAVGLWMLWRGAWPAWLNRRAASPSTDELPGGWRRVAGPVRGAGAGALWIAWPCALSQSALLVAALASTAQQGAAAMALFAVASSPALWAGPMLMRRVAAARTGRAVPSVEATWPLRMAGALIALGSAWALTHGLWSRVAAWCGLA
jgi:sulfite exporter TauE/SafE